MVCVLANVYDFAKLLDFGIARKIRPDGEEAGRAVPFGTPYFTAPELLTGAEDADGRADIYSLGVLCFYLLEACLPFPGGLGGWRPFRYSADYPRPVRRRYPGSFQSW